MFESLLEPNVFAVCFLGFGGSILGLIGLLAASRRKTQWGFLAAPLLIVILAGFAGAAAALGQPSAIWELPLAMAGLCAAFLLFRMPQISRFCAAMVSLAGKPMVQWGFLLAISPLLAMGWVHHAEEMGPVPLAVESIPKVVVDHTNLQPVTPSPATTDRGRPVPLFKNPTASPGAAIDQEELDLIQACKLSEEIIRTSPADEQYNCHGWTFTGGAYWLKGQDVDMILEDNGYRPVTQPQVGDLAIYRDPQGHIIHSGLVRSAEKGDPVLVESKWGMVGRFIHPADRSCYEAQCTFYHSRRHADHTLRGMEKTQFLAGEPNVLATGDQRQDLSPSID